MINTRQRPRDYTRNSLTTIKSYKRTRNGNVQIIEQSTRGNKLTFICKECNISFEVKGYKLVRKFCTRACYIKDWNKRLPGHNKGEHGVYKAWNKDLTKETDASVAKYSKSMKKTVQKQFDSGQRTVNGYRHWKDTDIEILLRDAFIKENIIFKQNYPINLKNFVTFPDFYIKESKLCIYADGEYWHHYPTGSERDILINKLLPENGYTILRFWGKEIKNNLSDCVSKVKEKI